MWKVSNPIEQPEFIDQVTNASKESWVLVHLYQSQIPDSNLLSKYWTRLAQLYPQTKFCAIRADSCIENYPDRNVPTILVYHEGEMRQQIVTLRPILSTLGVSQAMFEDIERYFCDMGALEMSFARKKELDEVTLDREETQKSGKIRVGFH